MAVLGSLKLGRYVSAYQDLSVPVNGFQMQVLRTFDSTDKRIGDFGVGWRVGLANFTVSENRVLGAGGWTETSASCVFALSCAFITSVPHYVTVTWPGGMQEVFDFAPVSEQGLFYLNGHAASSRALAPTPRPR